MEMNCINNSFCTFHTEFLRDDTLIRFRRLDGVVNNSEEMIFIWNVLPKNEGLHVILFFSLRHLSTA